MQLHLIEKDLWDALKLNSVIPTNANELAKWNIKDHKALGTIGLSLSKAYLHHVDFGKSAKEIWESLNNPFGSEAESAKTTLKQRLYGLKMEKGTKMANHISKFHSLLNQLASINEKVKDDDTKAILLNSFPKHMSGMVFTLSKVTISLEGVISTLLYHNEDLEFEEVLFVHNKERKGKYKYKNVPSKGKIKCFYCNEMGHIILNCKKRAQNLLDDKLDHASLAKETDWENHAKDEELSCSSDEEYVF